MMGQHGKVRLAIERRGHGTDWVCERVLYRQRTTPDAHVADGRFRSSRGAVTAVEVELTLKSAERLRDIVRDLTLDHEAVLYVVSDPAIGRAVDTAARSVGERERVRVVELARVVFEGA
jgi:putative lipoic acid-binding regulatory protein